MASQACKKSDVDRRIVHCLLCHKPQEMLPAHLARVCMKNSTPEERAEELQKAKESMKKWTRQGRTWNYDDMCERYTDKSSRFAMVSDLLERGFFVENAPNPADMAAEAEPQLPPSAVASSSQPEDADSSSEESASTTDSDSTGGPCWKKQTDDPSYSGVRLTMQKMGLYEKFPADTSLLVEFKLYLINHLEVPNCQQEVDNVSRMLRFMQPTGDDISMEFLKKSTETKDYIISLKRAHLLPATILNYIKNMIRFCQFLMTRDVQDQEFRRSCESYVMLLNVLRKPISKSHSKTTCKTRYERFLGGQKSLAECQKLLKLAKKDMLDIFGQLMQMKVVLGEQKTLFRYYCEAILVLGHFQRPGAVEGMSVAEWVNKKNVNGRVCVGVSQHKTATMQIATFALTMEEAAMLDAYYLYVRPDLVLEGNVEDEDKFFINSNGKPLRSATNDVARLHAHYKLPNVTSQEIRRTVETEASTALSEEQKNQVAHYMAHSTQVANAHYRMKTQEAIVATANMLTSLTGYSSDESVEGSSKGRKRVRDDSEETPPGNVKTFTDFVTVFPVTLKGQPPCKRQRADAGFPLDRCFYDKWRATQYGKREEYLLSKSYRRPPSVDKVAKLISSEGWTANYPRPEDIVAKWLPAKRSDVETDPEILKKISKQKWSGLAIKDFGDERGQGVVATRVFPKGSVLCDYHGKIITAEEGRKMLEKTHEEMGYLFFFSSGNSKLCVDAQTHPCECHPTMETVGRKMNHSRKNYNVKPQHCLITCPDGKRDVILMIAAKDIGVNDELKFDYGVNRKSFRGEGLDLQWLDQ